MLTLLCLFAVIPYGVQSAIPSCLWLAYILPLIKFIAMIMFQTGARPVERLPSMDKALVPSSAPLGQSCL